MSTQTSARLDDDIAGILGAEDVTARLLNDASGPGDYVRRVREAKPATKMTPTLAAVLGKLSAMDDHTGGLISNFLAYGKIMRHGGKTWQRDLVRLMKAGRVRVLLVKRPPPIGSTAMTENPHDSRYYLLDVAPA